MKATLVYAERPEPLSENVDVSTTRSYVESLGQHLEDSGHQVRMHPLKDDPLGHMGSAISDLADTWAREIPDVAHAHLWTSGLASVAASRVARAQHVPVVFSPHALGIAGATGRSRKWLRLKAAIARDADRVTVSSTSDRDTLMKLGVGRRNIDVIPHAIDEPTFEAEMSHDKGSTPPRVVAAGPLDQGSGLATAIEAVSFLPGVELVVASTQRPVQSGGPAIDDEVSRLRDVAQRHKVAGRVRLMAVPDQVSVPELVRSADVLVCAPWYEQERTIELEAMAYGCAVVATDVGELRDVIIEGNNGVLVPPRDARALARALFALLHDPVKRDGFAMSGVLRIRARHAWPRVIDQVERSYESAVHRGGQ